MGSRPSSGAVRNFVIVAAIVAALWALAGELVATGIADRDGSRPVPGGLSAVGRVVSVRDLSGRGGPDYVAKVVFVTGSGQQLSFSSPDLKHSPRVGDPVRVSYSPTDPAGAHDLDATASPWLENIILGAVSAAMGCGVAACYVVVVLDDRRRARPGG